MAARVTVTLGGTITLVGDIGFYRPFLFPDHRVFTGPGPSVTIQDFGRKIKRAAGELRTGGAGTAGLISRATLAALETMLGTRGATQSFSDSVGNVGSVKLLGIDPAHEHGSTTQVALFSFALRWRWLALTQRYGSAYSE